MIIANPEDEEISEIPAIRLRRQVAGLMGYYTRIPAMIGEKAVKSIRLVTPKVNRSIILVDSDHCTTRMILVS